MVWTCFVTGDRGRLEASSEAVGNGSNLHPGLAALEAGQCCTLVNLGALRGGAHGPLVECGNTLREFCSSRLQEVGHWLRPRSPRAPALGPGLPRPAVLKQVGRPGGAGSPGGNLLVLVGPRVAAGPLTPRDASRRVEGLCLPVEQARLCPDPAGSLPPPWPLPGCGGPASAPPPGASRSPRAVQSWLLPHPAAPRSMLRGAGGQPAGVTCLYVLPSGGLQVRHKEWMLGFMRSSAAGNRK